MQETFKMKSSALLFQTRHTGERSAKVAPFNVKIDYSTGLVPDEVKYYDHMVVELKLGVQYRVFSGDREGATEAERISRRAIIDRLYGPLLMRLNEIKRAVYYDDKELTLEVIREAQEWIHALEKN